MNELGSNVLQYVPYGVTTLEMRIEGEFDQIYGILYPRNNSGGKNKIYVGYVDATKDFLIVWGSGNEEGLEINHKNVDKRLFLQFLHTGNSIQRQTVSILHNKMIRPVATITLIPPEHIENFVRMKSTNIKEYRTISFEGNSMPFYYSRWFPPRPSEQQEIQYMNIESPKLTMKFKVKDNDDTFLKNIDSDIEIFLDNQKIGEITGDWRYASLHAEIFTVFGDDDWLVLRVWLYWIHQNFSKNIFYGGNTLLEMIDKPPDDEQTRRGWWESFDIECPDIERFDFLINVKHKRILWVGTDFHYQEFWYKIDDASFVKARIANDVNTLEQVFRKLKFRLNQKKDNYNPITLLKEILKSPEIEKSFVPQSVPKIGQYIVTNLEENGNVTYRAQGFTRKHVPYVENASVIAELVSSVVTS